MNRRDLLKTLTLAAAALGIPLTALANPIKIGDKVLVDLDKMRQFILSHPDVPSFDYSHDYICKCAPGDKCFCLPNKGKPEIKISISPENRANNICKYYQDLGTGTADGIITLVVQPHSQTPDKNPISVPFWLVKFPEKKIVPPVDPKYWRRWRLINYTPNISIHPSFLKKA